MWNRLFRKKIKTTSSVRNDEETSSLSDFRQNSSTSSLRKKSLTLSKVINTLTLKSSNGKKNKNNKNYFRYIDDSNVAESSIFNSHYNYENDDDKIYSKTKNRREFGDFETTASSDDKTSSATLKPDPTSLPSDGIQGKPLDAAENASSAFEDTVPTSLELRSCPICTRTFVPVTLAKHVKICEKMAMKKRKKFDSFRQRREGTDLADFLPKNFGLPASKISSSTSVSKSTPAKVQQHVSSENLEKKKDEPTSTKLGPKSSNRKLVSPAGSTAALLKEKTRKTTKQLILNPPTEQCPFCERCFGAKAYDRHVEWCKEKRKITGSKNNATLSAAKERLEARTKYRAPCLKSKRAANREKYSGFGFSDDYDEGRMDMEPYSDKFLMSTSLTSSVTSEGLMNMKELEASSSNCEETFDLSNDNDDSLIVEENAQAKSRKNSRHLKLSKTVTSRNDSDENVGSMNYDETSVEEDLDREKLSFDLDTTMRSVSEKSLNELITEESPKEDRFVNMNSNEENHSPNTEINSESQQDNNEYVNRNTCEINMNLNQDNECEDIKVEDEEYLENIQEQLIDICSLNSSEITLSSNLNEYVNDEKIVSPSKSYVVSDPSDKYDPFISAKRQLQELCSAPLQVNPTLPTPSSLSIGTTMGKSTDTTSSVFNEQQTLNNTSLQKSNFRRSASLRVTRKRTPPPSLTSTRPLFTPNALTYKSTIHRGLSDEGPISHSFLKPEEYDEMPVKSVCVNEYAITHSSRMTKRDSHPSVHQRHFKTTLNNNSANKITHNNNHLKSIEKTINPLSKTDSLKIFLKHEKETARDSTEEIASDLLGKENEDKNNILNELHRCSYRTHSANSNSNKNNNPHSSSIKNSEDNVTTSVPKEIEKYSNHRQNDIYHYPKSPNNNNNNNNTVATISTANKLHSIKLEPLPKIPSVKDLNSNKNTSTQTAMLPHHSTHHDPSISAHFSQSSSNIVNNSVISPLSSISFNPLHLPKSILNRVTPPPCVVSSNPPTTSIKLNLILDNPYKSGENDNSNNGSDRELIDSVEGGRSDLNLVSNDTNLPKIINETSRAAEEKPKQIQNSQNNNNYSDVCMPKLMQILQEEKEQNLFSSSSPVESDKISKPAKRKTMRKRQISLGKNQFLYDMPSENEPSSEEYCGTTYSTDDVFHEQIVGNKGENNSNKPNNIMIPNLDDVNIEEFLNSFEGDEEQFSVFKDFKEFLLNHAVIHTTLLNKTNDFIDIFCSSTPNRSDKNDQNTKEIDLPHSDGNSDYDYIESDNEGNKNEIFISIETDKSDYPNPLTFESRSNPNSIKYTDVTNESMKSRERAFDNTNNEIFNKYETPDLYNKKITENNNIDNNVNINNTKNMMKTMQGEFDNYSHSFKQHPVEKMKNLQSGQEENCTEEDSQRYEDIDISPTANLSGSKTALPKAQWQNDSDEMNSSVENFPHQQNITRSKQSADSAYGSPVEVRSINRDSFGSIPPVMKACPASRSKRSQIYQKQKHNEVNLEIGQQLDDEHSYNHDYQNIQRSYHDIQQGHSRRSRNLSSSESETSLPQIQSQNNMKPNNYEMQIDFQDKDISDNSNKYKRRNSSQSEKREPRLFKFCHECGSEFLVIEAKFCTECGVKRIILE